MLAAMRALAPIAEQAVVVTQLRLDDAIRVRFGLRRLRDAPASLVWQADNAVLQMERRAFGHRLTVDQHGVAMRACRDLRLPDGWRPEYLPPDRAAAEWLALAADLGLE
jgi:hypothetical protein